jgi:glutamyl-tRNA reductase
VKLTVIGCHVRTAPVELRERLAFTDALRDRSTQELATRFGVEAMILSTCNRVELILGRPVPEESRPLLDLDDAARFLAECHAASPPDIRPLLYRHDDQAAVQHLFRVASSLDSLVVGEGQIAGQIRQSYDAARTSGTTGPLLNTVIPQALRAAKRVRTETGIAQGHVSISSVAIDFVRQVYDHFGDKTVLVIGAGKMGRLTLKHLQELKPRRIVVTNRSAEKAAEVARDCGGEAVPWDQLDRVLIEADLVLSTTGASEPIFTRDRYLQTIAPHRSGRPLVILDIAVPRDFDPAIHDGDRVCVFNIDDLSAVREKTLTQRRRHIAPAEAIVDHEVNAFFADWNRRRSGPVIRQLTAEFDRVRSGVVSPLLSKWNGKLTPDEKKQLEYAFQLFQNQLLHGPIAALQDASRADEHHPLLDALRKLFRLGE